MIILFRFKFLYIYAFGRLAYLKRLTLHSSFMYILFQVCVIPGSHTVHNMKAKRMLWKTKKRLVLIGNTLQLYSGVNSPFSA